MEQPAQSRHVPDVGDVVGYTLEAQFDVVVEPSLPGSRAHRPGGWETSINHPWDVLLTGRTGPVAAVHGFGVCE